MKKTRHQIKKQLKSNRLKITITHSIMGVKDQMAGE